MRETVRDAAARRGRFVVLSALAALLMLAPGLLELDAARSAQSASDNLITRGYTTYKVTAQGGGATLSAPLCGRLSGQSGVLAAGGVAAGTPSEDSSQPGDGFAVLDYVGDAPDALSGTHAATGVVVSTDLAAELGVARGSVMGLSGLGDVLVGRVAPLGIRDAQLGRVVLVPASSSLSAVQACYIQFDATARPDDDVAMLSSVFGGGTGLEISPLVPHDTTTADPRSAWKTRPSRYAWLLAGPIAGALFAVALALRRRDLGLLLLTGSSRTEVATFALLQTSTVAWLGALSAALWVVASAATSHSPTSLAAVGLTASARTALAAIVIAPTGLLWLLRRDQAAVLRERGS